MYVCFMRFLCGLLIMQCFEVISRLGAGSFGEVFTAQCLHSNV